METNISFDDIIHEIQQSDTREQIEYYCHAFCRYLGFENFLLFGSIFTSLISPPSYVISSPDRSVRNKRRQLENIFQACMNSSTPIVTGNIDKDSLLYNSLIKTCRTPATKNMGISFPVHFPLGKLAFLHISTPVEKQEIEEKTLAALAPGNLFAREASSSILHLLECELENKPPFLSQREKECLLLASDGETPGKIGEHVGLSAHTVIFHLKKAREKLNSKNIQGAVSKAMLSGDVVTRIGSEKT